MDFQLKQPLQYYDVNGVNITNLWETYNVGAYSAFFAYDCALVIGLVIAYYCDVAYIRRVRFALFLVFEIIACALGISAYLAFKQASKTPTNIAYSALVLVLLNLVVGVVDWITRFHKSVHLFHALLSNATLWVGCVSVMSWYRDAYYYGNYKDIWVFSFIAMWSGAMIALPFPGFFTFLLTRRGMYAPDAVKSEEETEKLKKKGKEVEMQPASHMVTIHVQKDKDGDKKDKEKDKGKNKKKKDEDSDDESSESEEEETKKKKKKNKKEEKKEKPKEKEKEKPKRSASEKGTKKEKEKEGKSKAKEKEKEKEKTKKKKKKK